MKRANLLSCRALFLVSLLLTFFASQSFAVSVDFVSLGNYYDSDTGDYIGIFRADLSSLGFAPLSITIIDNGSTSGLGGEFSGFDLTAIRLSDTSTDSPSAAVALVGLPLFDFSASGTIFTPGTRSLSIISGDYDEKLYGTDSTGTALDNSVATLGVFDYDGSISLGHGGRLTFNLTEPAITSGGLYLYIGESGGNGETATGEVFSTHINPVPEPSTIFLFGSGMALAFGWRNFRKMRN